MDGKVESSVDNTNSQSENVHPTARKRFQREESKSSSDSDNDYTPYVPLKERRKQQEIGPPYFQMKYNHTIGEVRK
ncbi:hypothetical protein MTO96_011485 [Rhipicephalus appendiculatus]